MTHRDIEQARITLFTVFAAVSYGIIHDQITAHLCVEYFSVAHPPYFHTTSPAVLGLCWGIAATAPIGAVLGTLLATASQAGALPPYPARRLYRLISILLAASGLAALFAGILGFELSQHSVIAIPSSFAEVIPADHYDRFMAVWFAHIASYLVGLGGGTLLMFRIWFDRGRPYLFPLIPRTRWDAARFLLLITIVAAVLYLRFTRS